MNPSRNIGDILVIKRPQRNIPLFIPFPELMPIDIIVDVRKTIHICQTKIIKKITLLKQMVGCKNQLLQVIQTRHYIHILTSQTLTQSL